MQSSKQVEKLVSVIELKNLARTMLPLKSTLRMLILAEPDTLPRDQALAKMDVYARLLYTELEGTN